MVAINEYNNYEIDKEGNIFSLKRNKYIKPIIQKSGYKYIHLCKNGKSKSFLLHRLIGIHFISNPKNLPEINHKDGNKLNNLINNLEWVTRSENQKHAYLNKLNYCYYGEKHHNSKKVGQYTKSGKLLKTWNSVIEAANNVLNTSKCIHRVCRKERKTYNKFVWKYIEV
jgi:hypothetical protein